VGGKTLLTHDGPLSAAAYMLGALLRGRRTRPKGPVLFPPLRLRCIRFATTSTDGTALRRLTGLGEEGWLPLLAPHVTGFRALMALLTHAAVPLPIWRALQVRNRLVLHRPVVGHGALLATWRAPKGAGLQMARLSGDCNPLHLSPGQARRRGFQGAFLHPMLAVGQCLAHLPGRAPSLPRRLDFWVRGQVYAGAEERPALVGQVGGGP